MTEPGNTATTDTASEPTYLVLRETKENGVWEMCAGVKATSADQAVRKAAKDDEGRYVAVPARSFQPRTVKIITERKVQLS